MDWKHCSCWQWSRKKLCRLWFLLRMEGWKLFPRFGSYFHPGAPSRSCRVCWSEQKGDFCWHWERGKKWQMAKMHFFAFRCQLRCLPQWRTQRRMWRGWVPRGGNVCSSLRLPTRCTRSISRCPFSLILSLFLQAIFFSKYTKSSCQLENNLKNLLDKFKYGAKCCQPFVHEYHLKMSALLPTKSTRLCDQEVCPRIQNRRPNRLQVAPRLFGRSNCKQTNCPPSSDQLYIMKSAYEKNRYFYHTQI